MTNGAVAICCCYLSRLQLSVGLGCVWQDLFLYRCSQKPPPPLIFFFSVVFLGFNICRVLISAAEGAGMRGMQALGLPVYSEGFLQYPPTPPSWFPFKDFSHFCPCCFGNRSRARRTGASCSIPEFFPTAFSYSPAGFLFFLLPQNSTVSFNSNLITFECSFDCFTPERS